MAEKSASRCLVRVPIELVQAAPHQPRQAFSQSSIAELAASIARYGLLSPLVVRAVPDGYQLIAGERRLRALKLLGAGRADALVLPVGDCDAALMALAENLQREDLHYLEEAAAYRALIEQYHLSQQELANRLGKSQSGVANKLRLLKLPDSVRAALLQSGLSERHARALLRLTDEEAQNRALERAAEGGLSVSETEALVEKLQSAPERAARCVTRYFRDHRLFVNALLDTVRQLNRAGVQATSRVVEQSDCIEVIVRLPRAAAQAAPQRGA